MIRKAVVEDAGRLAEMHIGGWRHAYRGIIADAFLFGKLDVCRRAENIRKELEEGAGEHYVAERGGVAAAFMVMGPSRDEDKRGEGKFELWAIYSEPALKRSGLGGELLAFCEREAGLRGMREVSLWVLERNAAGRAFYEKHGYRPDGARKVLERLPSADTGPVAEIRYVKSLG
jgi:ribosomal protein S18 acetylase RimI-like enzyme